MRHRASVLASVLAASASLLLLGCSSGNKQPANPTPPDNGAKADPGAGSAAPAAKKEPPPDTGGYKLVQQPSLTYAPLDPSKPDGPAIATVSGDMQKGGGFFLRLPAGFKSGLHTHTADYHAVVVSGAPKHWLPGEDKKAAALGAGSYWFQPGGQPHGDECTGTEPCLVYLVLMGGFDFAPAPNAKPVKPGKYTLVSVKDVKWNPMDPKQPNGAKMGLVSGDPKTGPVAFIVEMPPGTNAGLHSHTSEYHAVVIQGAPAHWLPHEANEGEPLSPGAYWYQPGGYDHGDRCAGAGPCRAFVMMPKALDFKPGAAPKK
jgi:quercetin dioxygenase-like cupin family protein